MAKRVTVKKKAIKKKAAKKKATKKATKKMKATAGSSGCCIAGPMARLR